MKKLILLCLILTLLITTMTSCLINGTTEPVVITHNPKNLLYLEESGNTFDRREVYMSFTMPQDFVATSYTLQFSDSNSPYNFVTMTNSLDEEYTTENPLASGYSVPIPTPHLDGYFRLKINGGTYDGQYSNIIYATQCAVDADVNWSLDYSMFNTGTMSPYVGFGIVADFTLVDSDDGDIEDGLTYEWFRVNPNDFEDSEVIVGQTDLSYTTTSSDIDHYILVVATGTDENFSGGICCALLDFVVTR